MKGTGRFELVEGEVVELTPPGFEHGDVAGNAFFAVKAYVKGQRLGRVVMEAGFFLRRGPDTVRGPDISYYSYERLPSDLRPKGYAEAAPDLAVEVVSPNDRSEEVEARIRELFEAGVARLWVVYPLTRTVHDWTGPASVGILEEPDTLEGDPQLPGFRMPVGTLFED